MTTYTDFPGAAPWTFTAVANTQAGGARVWRLTITNAAALASQYLEVDLIVSGGRAPDNPTTVYVAMSFNSTFGDIASGRTWEYIDGSSLPTTMYVPFMIPNRYLVTGGVLYIYGYTSNNGVYVLNAAQNLILTVNSRRNTV
jgi:hypothetical protein